MEKAVMTSESRRSGGTHSLWSRRRAMAAATSALAAMALAAAMAGRGCRVDANSPEGAVREFVAAAGTDDYEALYDLLGPATRERLEAAAKRATDLAGGSNRYSPIHMISIGKAEGTTPKDIIVQSADDKHAIVEIVDTNGERAQLGVVYIDGAWRIELPGYGNAL